ncbi:multidrug resistance-associated protein 2 (MRP2) [Plasmodium ovale curtisi]|uniref:Multidrug resistance-associated protein 2 (MRP2) n=1 Tax=Plasmodium ovale curtisi TaxID=864141 RepID=A0A1A8WAA7_PLAOA|nr:multidrug resistance-associated protein 2 (MRP2) [Plasmodium ovale curtisi]
MSGRKWEEQNGQNRGCIMKNISFFRFVTFDWITKLLSKIKNDEHFELPVIEENNFIGYYTHELGKNIKKISGDNNRNRNRGGVTIAVLKAFKLPLCCVTFFHIIHTLFLIFVALCIEKYILLIKGQYVFSVPYLQKYSNFIFGLLVVSVICFDLFFDAVLTFFDYRLRLNMEVTVMYFLYKINLGYFSNSLTNFPPHAGEATKRGESTGGGGEATKGRNVTGHQVIEMENMKTRNDERISLKEEKKPINEKNTSNVEITNGGGGGGGGGCDINIYNIMFVDTPFLIYFISSLIDLCNMVIKFIISFYMFYYKMGGEAVFNGVCLITLMYSLMFTFEFAASLYKIKYLKYRDSRIDNMHHVLKEYKLMKIFNWESIAFDYINDYRKKEMKYCKIRIYLNSLSNYINNISVNVVEVGIFFFFIKGELNSNKPINVSSIITPLFVYKSLISGISNFPNVINNLLEGVINIGRINRYIQHYLQQDFLLESGKLHKRNDPYAVKKCRNYWTNGWAPDDDDDDNVLFPGYPTQNGKSKNYEQFRKNMNTQGGKRVFTNFFRLLFFQRKRKNVYPLHGCDHNWNRNLDRSLDHSKDHIRDQGCSYSVRISVSDDPMENVIVKLENCSFVSNRGSNVAEEECKLKDINLTLRNNTIAIIIGNVGSGKTLFFNSMLGKLKLVKGNYYVKNFLHNMPVLYVPQINWVSVGTVRSMIVFGNKYDPSIYYQSIVQSELLYDIISFKKKDLRYVNDEHSLSNGQKARICLARALYHHYIHMKDLLNIYKSRQSDGKCDYQGGKYLCEKENKTVNYSCNTTISTSKEGGMPPTEVTELPSTSVSASAPMSAHMSAATPAATSAPTSADAVSGRKFHKENVPFVEEEVRSCLEESGMSYLYLLDDVFSALDPCIATNIFYNLFCDKEKISQFKDRCGFVITMNENIWKSLLTKQILSDLQYEVHVYKLGNNTLHFEGEASEYVKKNNITIKEDAQMENFTSMGRKRRLSSFCQQIDLPLDENEQLGKRRKSSDIKFNKFILLKQLKTMYSFRVEPVMIESHLTDFKRKYTTVTQNYVEDELELKKMGSTYSNSYNNIGGKKCIGSYVEFLIKDSKQGRESMEENEELHIHEFERVNKMLQAQLKNYYAYDEYMYDNENEGDLSFKGNIKIETFIWYLSKLGKSLICIIVIFMLCSIFLDEIKNVLLFVASTLLKSGDKNDEEILKKQLVYLKYFVLLPSISLVTTLIAFMLIAYGVTLSASKIHTEVLHSILYAPIHAFYSNNLGNIISRFITDINVLDNGIIKRIYKTFYTFFRFLFTIFLLIYMIKYTYCIFPFIMLIIYIFVFKRYSHGCKEAQRGFLSTHSPLCTIYSNTIIGKDIINLYKKNEYFLKIYENRIFAFRNYTIFKWSITIWASLYVQLIVLLLTLFYIMYPHIFSHSINDNEDPVLNEIMHEKYSSTIGYCITFSCSLGFIIKALLYDYTHVEKEMCSTQRLEECSNMIHERVFVDEEKAVSTSVGGVGTDGSGGSGGGEVDGAVPSECFPLEGAKSKYGLHFENVFVSYKKKVYVDKTNNVYHYANEKSCLRNINIYALRGQNIGIVGKSGAGKSTTILSILGLIPTTRGRITIEGRDIQSMSLEEKKKIIGVLPQSSFTFFNWNIRTFIDPYKNFTDVEIVDAFKLIGINLSFNDLDKYIYKQKKKKKGHNNINREKKCMNMHNFISLSDDCIRYLSLVRIFLNRHNYKLVLIDEIPVFNFNNNSTIKNTFFTHDIKSFDFVIRNYFKKTTVLIITHDASTLSCCDFIYVVSKGEVVYKCSYADVKTQVELANIIERQTR